jgi:uncharacterized protein with PQ loop repeat
VSTNLFVRIVTIGIFASYLPQHYRIISRRSSEGISPYFVLLGTVSATCAFGNILSMPDSRHAIACCSRNSGLSCFSGLLGIAQIGAQWFCFTVTLLLFLIFFPRSIDLAPPSPGATTWRTAVGVATLCFLHKLATFLVTAALLLFAPGRLMAWASLLGLCGAALACVQYVPQIITTCTLKHVGSLSIPMMLIQTPGGFLLAGSLAARLGPQGWSTWGIFLVTAAAQGVLLVLAIYYELRNRKTSRSGWASEHQRARGNLRGAGNVDEEISPLLA